ncbi:MAG: glycosyltransferase family 2 protein [Alphaproteobacteria bacterium]
MADVMPDVSIIIAAYNVENYIEQAIHSALNQNGVSVEIIVVNDASKDGTKAAIACVKDPRITTIDLATNKGAAGARNAGIAVAKGRWIAVLDGDDALTPNRLKDCLAKAGDADIITDNLQVRDESTGNYYNMYPEAFFTRTPILNLTTFIKGNQSFLGDGISLGYLKPIFACAFLQKHDLQYDPDIHIGEDYMLLAEALAAGALCKTINDNGYIYTKRRGSTSHRLTLDDIHRIQSGDKKFLAKYPLNAEAQDAQNKRTANLAQAAAFTQLVEAIKQHKMADIFTIALEHPSVLFLLWRPLFARVSKIIG